IISRGSDRATMSALGQKQTCAVAMSALCQRRTFASDMISIKSSIDMKESAHANFAWKTWQGPEWPKGEIHGGEVERSCLEGKIKEVADYCETDIVNTYAIRSVPWATN
ncbi:MAG: hypothetical protein WBV51_09315, partial [Pseudolabrys sp.]